MPAADCDPADAPDDDHRRRGRAFAGLGHQGEEADGEGEGELFDDPLRYDTPEELDASHYFLQHYRQESSSGLAHQSTLPGFIIP